jgi:hypothetical protein
VALSSIARTSTSVPPALQTHQTYQTYPTHQTYPTC